MIEANLEHVRKLLNNPNLTSYQLYLRMRENQRKNVRELRQLRIEQDIQYEIMDEIMMLVRQQLNEGAAENVAPGAEYPIGGKRKIAEYLGSSEEIGDQTCSKKGKIQFLETTLSRSRGTQTENVVDEVAAQNVAGTEEVKVAYPIVNVFDVRGSKLRR